MRVLPVLAANLETLIGVAFVVISLISGLMNYLNSRAAPNGQNRPGGGGPAGRPARPRSERIQSEIEQFMREQVRRQDADVAPPRPQPERPPAPQRQTPRRQNPQRGPAPRPANRKSPPPARPQPINQSGQSSPLVRPGQDISHRKSVSSGGLGESLRDHLQSTMVERVQSGAQSHLGQNVSNEVTRHLGIFTGGISPQPSTAGASAPSANEIANELRSREGMRKALIAQIILERPPSLRRR